MNVLNSIDLVASKFLIGLAVLFLLAAVSLHFLFLPEPAKETGGEQQETHEAVSLDEVDKTLATLIEDENRVFTVGPEILEGLKERHSDTSSDPGASQDGEDDYYVLPFLVIQGYVTGEDAISNYESGGQRTGEIRIITDPEEEGEDFLDLGQKIYVGGSQTNTEVVFARALTAAHADGANAFEVVEFDTLLIRYP